jgi:hypothetical protein
MNHKLFWQTKLAARLHDPAEKALVLLRDPAGHEGGTSKSLMRLLGLQDITAESLADMDPDNADALSRVIFQKGLSPEVYKTIQRADWWAAAADRPQWPMKEITVTTRKGAQRPSQWPTGPRCTGVKTDTDPSAHGRSNRLAQPERHRNR